jgi:GTP-binding protein
VKLRDVRFVAGVAALAQMPERKLPQVAFLGPSNVGKSSLVNALLGKGMARVSKTPGRTQELNFFLVNDAYHFVDLPGYGFAKAPRAVQERFRKLVEDYLSATLELKLLVLLQDSRRTPSERDLELVRWLSQNGVPHVVVLTKADKISKGQWKPTAAALRRAFDRPDLVVQPFSALSGEGHREVWGLIDVALGLRSG